MALVDSSTYDSQQGVVHDAAQRDAVIGENVTVVFQVLADLRLARVFQPRLQLSNANSRDSCGGASG